MLRMIINYKVLKKDPNCRKLSKSFTETLPEKFSIPLAFPISQLKLLPKQTRDKVKFGNNPKTI